MIHHVSIEAQEPAAVAEAFAELMGGVSVPFPPNPGSFVALAQDGKGTGIEVYPEGTVLRPNGETGGRFDREGAGKGFGPVHFALSVPVSAAEVAALARRMGWHCFHCRRGGVFGVIELWVENTSMVEILPEDYAAEYLAFASRAAEMFSRA
jgi:hypothetical protein